MKIWLAVAAGIVVGLPFWLARPVAASGTFSISQTFPTANAVNVPVNLLSSAYHPNFGYADQAIALALSGMPADCAIDRSTFTQQTVHLTSPTDHQTYFLTSPTANLSSGTPWLAVGSPTLGFELLPFTGYSLVLQGGSSGIGAMCANQDYWLDHDTTISFTTGADTIPPQILGPQVQTTNTTATVHWETFQAASGRVAYGTTGLNQIATESGVGTLHRVSIPNLEPGTTYMYQIQSRDPAGNVGTSSGHFTTVGLGEIRVKDISDMAATIYWTSNQPTDTIIEFGLTDSYGDRQGNGGQLTNHTWRLVGLRPDTTYHFRVVATNSNGSSTFGDNFFTTAAAPSIAGATDGQTEGISTSNDNNKLFPLISFQPLVLGASRAAAVAGDTITVGRNLLTGGVITNQETSWLGWLIWLLPIILVLAIGGLWWWLRRTNPHTL